MTVGAFDLKVLFVNIKYFFLSKVFESGTKMRYRSFFFFFVSTS